MSAPSPFTHGTPMLPVADVRGIRPRGTGTAAEDPGARGGSSRGGGSGPDGHPGRVADRYGP